MDGALRRFSTAPNVRAPRIGLALSYGAARGLAHIGVLQVFEEEGIPISIIAGSSMGAYVGALWAAGIDGKGLQDLAAEINHRQALLKLVDLAMPPTTGLVHGRKLRRHLARTFGERTLEDLERKVLVVATNLDTVNGEILKEMPAATAVLASCAIPGICSPVRIGDKRYIDGGAAEPLPVRLLRSNSDVDHVIAVNVMPTHADMQRCQVASFPAPPPQPPGIWERLMRAISRRFNLFEHGNVLDTFKRCLTAAQMQLVADECSAADVVIHPFLCDSKWYDFENHEAYIEAGRRAAKSALPAIRTLLQKSPKPSKNHETVSLIPSMGRGAA
jgi:NTE family protein